MGLEQGIKTQDLPGIPKVGQGKVREMFEVDGQLLMVATDRISAFDVILPMPSLTMSKFSPIYRPSGLSDLKG